MNRLLLKILGLVIVWIGYGVYTSIRDHPEVIWKDNEIVGMKNCEREELQYNTSCSKIYCEYELSKMKEIEGFVELKIIQIVSTSLKPGGSLHLAEVTLPVETTYYMCDMYRDVVNYIEQTTKDEFEFKNDL